MANIIRDIKDPVVIDLLQQGRVGVLPTDTLYGLVAAAEHTDAVRRLYGLKQREQKPGTIIAANPEQLVSLGIKARYVKAVEHFWPNALSVVLPTGPDLAYLHRGKMSLAVRIPKDATLQTLLGQTGPLLTTSANASGQPANTIAEAQAYFGDTVDFYVDGGDLTERQPSTVIRIIDDAIEVLRSGAVTIDENGRISGNE